ncbi:NADP-dependent malic enzyme [Candidatus Micrarchaeota archaeon]|nr:NADP-dependent malic enzyme [Candidatus Micrarchaeota archaeon]MBU2477151.1 NADP-dependent malic enzyme [Candidatus Micrarchaeota archaeon]
MNLKEKAIELHKKWKGKLEVKSKVKIDSKEMLSLAYTPGVAQPCIEIAADKRKVFDYTIKSNTIAVITDGSAVLGLGNIGAEASLPVMEGKCSLFKELAGINAFPIALKTQKTKEIIETIKNISPVFGAINLEDISSPRCFEIEKELQNLGIPVMHDDQHATAIVVLAGLENALKVTGKKLEETKIVVNGIGAGGTGITKLLLAKKIQPKELILVDKEGILFEGKQGMLKHHEELAKITNPKKIQGNLENALIGADVFIGVSFKGILTKEMVQSMNSKAIVFALANPDPEIESEQAFEAGAELVATGRSDYPNQVNNVLAFPGVFKGALKAKATKINQEMKLAAVKALAECVENPTKENFIPSPLEKKVAEKISEAVKKAAIGSGVVRK